MRRRTPQSIFRAAAALLVALSLAACGTSPSVTYYTLPAGTATTPGATAANEYSVSVGPVTVPDTVDRPNLVLRSSPTQVQIAEFARWAAPLKHEIPRVIAQQLAQLLPGASTRTNVQNAGAPPDYRVLIDIQRFESSPGEGATIEATWSVRPLSGAAVSGRSVATDNAGAGNAALVEAHGRALEKVSRDIAAAIVKLRP